MSAKTALIPWKQEGKGRPRLTADHIPKVSGPQPRVDLG
jgi:hypothetical protein